MCSAARRRGRRLVMTFLALGTADILDGYAVHFAGFEVLVESLVNAVELVTVPGRIDEIDLCRTMAINTPTHAKGSELLHLVLLRYRSMTGLALYLSGFGVLCMAEEHVVGKVM